MLLLTVSSESAPREENLDSPETAESSGSASCFLTISHTLSTVCGLAYIHSFIVSRKMHTLGFNKLDTQGKGEYTYCTRDVGTPRVQRWKASPFNGKDDWPWTKDLALRNLPIKKINKQWRWFSRKNIHVKSSIDKDV